MGAWVGPGWARPSAWGCPAGVLAAWPWCHFPKNEKMSFTRNSLKGSNKDILLLDRCAVWVSPWYYNILWVNACITAKITFWMNLLSISKHVTFIKKFFIKLFIVFLIKVFHVSVCNIKCVFLYIFRSGWRVHICSLQNLYAKCRTDAHKLHPDDDTNPMMNGGGLVPCPR